MNRTLKAAGLALLSVLVLSGCIKSDIAFTLHEDDTVSGEIVFAVQEGIGEMMELGSDQEALDELFGENPFEGTEGNFSAEPYSQDGWVGQVYTFSDLPIAQAGEATGSGVTITRVDDTFVVETFSAPADDSEEIPEGAESTFTVTFPGEVTDHNGALDGTTVSWDMLTQAEPLYAEGSATSGGSFPLWIVAVILGVLLVAAVIAVVLVVVLRGRGGGSETAPGATPATEPTTSVPPPAPADESSVPEGDVPPPPPADDETK